MRDMKSGEWAYVLHGEANVVVVRLREHAMSLDGTRFGLDVPLVSPIFGSCKETEMWAINRSVRFERLWPE